MRNIQGLRRGNSPGRPRGVKNKVTRDVRALCQGLIEDAGYRENFERRLRAGELAPVLERMVWEFAYGRPAQAVTVTGGQLSLAQLIAGEVPVAATHER